MKKNKILTIACVLLIVAALSVSIIGGTFAKYVTKGSASDSARVAKWGVTIGSDGDLFSKTYVNKDDTVEESNAFHFTVQSATENLVAPGTANATGLKISITGAPEVAVNLAVAVEYTDVFLKVGEEVYRPIRYTLAAVTTGGNKIIKEKVDMADIATFFNSLSKDYAANTNLATGLKAGDAAIKDKDGVAIANQTGDYILTWEWVFEKGETDDDKDTYNGYDTILADIAAGIKTDAGTVDVDYSIKASFKIDIAVTQID